MGKEHEKAHRADELQIIGKKYISNFTSNLRKTMKAKLVFFALNVAKGFSTHNAQ